MRKKLIFLLFLLFPISTTVSAAAYAQGTPSASRVALAWDAATKNTDGSPCTDLAGYVISVGLAPGGPYEEAARVTKSEVSFSWVGPVDAEKVYYFVVQALDDDNNLSAYSNEVSGKIDTIFPMAPIMKLP